MKLCECGCGRSTLPYKVTDNRIGAVKGQFARRIKGHNPKNVARPITAEKRCRGCGRTLQRTIEFFYSDKSHRDGLSTRCKPCIDATNAKWKEANSAWSEDYHKAYRYEHAEDIRLYMRSYRRNNPELARDSIRRSVIKHRDKVRVARRAYVAKNRERVRLALIAAKHRRRVQIGVPVAKIDFVALYAKHRGVCGICCDPVAWRLVTWDHIQPLAKGGAHVAINLQPAHKLCNCIKGDRTLAIAQARIIKLKEANRFAL